jgi:hypothetical protein
VEVEEEGAERNSTKLDWYFWSRGAIRRWTWGVSIGVACIGGAQGWVDLLRLSIGPSLRRYTVHTISPNGSCLAGSG